MVSVVCVLLEVVWCRCLVWVGEGMGMKVVFCWGEWLCLLVGVFYFGDLCWGKVNFE